MADLLTSDPHLGHAKVAAVRGFDGVEAHDRAVLRNLARATNPGDRLWVLGDMAFGPDKPGRLRALREALPGRSVHAVLGNHDNVHPGNSTFADRAPWLECFDTVDTFARLRFRGTTVLLSHFPYDGDNDGSGEGGEERFEQWRLRDLGQVLSHGHTHSRQRASLSSRGTPQVHVGLDAWGLKPVPLSVVVETAHGLVP